MGELSVGDKSVQEWIRSDSTWALLLFFTFMVLVFYILLGMLVAILFAAFDDAKAAVRAVVGRTNDSTVSQA